MRKFSIGSVLSISHGRLLCDIGQVYEILNYMLDENLFTHQLPRAGEFCKPLILQQHPQLKAWDKHNEKITTENWKLYVAKAEILFGKELEVNKVKGFERKTLLMKRWKCSVKIEL